ncbi:type II secretion system minor pseudopilin GspJ [Thalassovita mediterranea]|nr:type II secretion system minor pseudopilin GspJ [Thalassovita mediterranea]
MTQRLTSSQSGFTLVETLVALLILSIMAVAGGSMLLGATSAGKQVREREAYIRSLDMAQAYIRGDLEAATPRAAESASGRGGPMGLTGGETSQTDALISFVRNGWINPEQAEARSGLQYIRYELTPDGELVRIAALRPDPIEATPTARQVLLTGIETVNLTFWRGDEMSLYWESAAGGASTGLPDRIDMEIRFDDQRTLLISSLAGGVGT